MKRTVLAPFAFLLTSACATYAPVDVAISPSSSGSSGSIEVPGAVSAADPRAQAAGQQILQQGGSATDAAIATMLALTVVEPQSSGIGGGGFYVRSSADGKVTTIDGRETAPAAATPSWFLDEQGKPLPFRKAVASGLSVGVPGNIALAAQAHAKHGKLSWDALFQPAVALARDGFLINPRLHKFLAREGTLAGNDPAGQALFFDKGGAPLPVGTRVRNPDLARTLAVIAKDGPSAFYGREAAKKLADKVARATPHAQAMTVRDVTNYQAQVRQPVCGSYRDHRVCGMGPPTSGGIVVLQMLAQLERFNLAGMGPSSPRFWHLFLESQRLAYADREIYLADSDFVPVPVAGLLDRAYLTQRSQLISPDKAIGQVEAGKPAGAPLAQGDGDELPEQGTSHFSVADAAGNVISYTSTIESVFGSGMVLGGYYLNNELTDFSRSPKQDGKWVANRVQGGKRPRSSMAPMIVFDPKGKPILAIGAAGGPTIPVQTARGIIGVVDFGLPAKEALSLPLIQAFGKRVTVEKGTMLEAMIPALEALGHKQVVPYGHYLKANALHLKGGHWVAARDPRVEPLLQIP